MGQNVLSHSDILHVDTDSQKLKADQKRIWWAWLKMDVASLVTF